MVLISSWRSHFSLRFKLPQRTSFSLYILNKKKSSKFLPFQALSAFLQLATATTKWVKSRRRSKAYKQPAFGICHICYLFKGFSPKKLRRLCWRCKGRRTAAIARKVDSFQSSSQSYEIIIISFCFANHCMSILLLEQSQIDRILLRKYGSSPNLQNQIKTPLKTQQQHSLSNRNNEVFPTTNYTPDSAILCSTYLISGHLSKGQCALNIRMHRRRQEAKVALQPLSSQQTPFKVADPRCLPQLAAKINAITAALRMEMVKVAFCSATGTVSVQLPLLLAPWSNQPTHSWQDNSSIQYIYKHYVRNTLPLLDQILQLARYPSTLTRYDHPSKVKHVQNVGKYAQMVNVSSHVAQGSSGKESADKERNRKIDIVRTVKCRVNPGQGLKKPLGLFSYDPNGNTEIDLQLSSEEIKAIQASISTPLCPKPKNPLDNSLNVNHVFVQDVFNLSLNKVNQGGFSTIYLSQIKYFCVYPTEGYEIFRPSSLELSNSKDLLHKCVVIKMEDQQGGFSRNAHEVEILKKMRNVSSVFLPKYYLFINKPNPLGNAVAMDYIPYDNLKAYMRSHFPSLSLFTKLYLLLSTVHAVRLLRDNRIVHLDLKPNNIMLSSNLVVKLIDFGESYHPQVCTKRSSSGQLAYKPGFTIPYSSPQIFSNETKYFTSKSDVFSLGVIMFQVLYNCFPFDILETTEVIDEVMERYLNKWLLSPEECEGSGQAFILRTMNGILSKCLSPEPSVRPELDWIAVVIRNCLQLLY